MQIAELKNILQFYLAAGSDSIQLEQPRNHLAAENSRPSWERFILDFTKGGVAKHPVSPASAKVDHAVTSFSDAGAPTRRFTALPPQQGQLKEALKSILDLTSFHNFLEHVELGSLTSHATNTCLGQGPQGAELMIICDPPDREEDRRGELLCDGSGVLLDKILSFLHLKRDEIYLTPILPWRPAGGRPPTNAMLSLCRPLIEKQIELVRPRLVLALGPAATSGLLNQKVDFLLTRGQWQRYNSSEGKEVPFLATFSLRPRPLSPTVKKTLWKDFLKVKNELKLAKDKFIF